MELNIKISRSVCWLILTLLAALFGFRLYKRHCAAAAPKPEAPRRAAAEQPFAPHIVVEQAGESAPQKETPAARTGTGDQPAGNSPFASRQFGGSGSTTTSTRGRKTAAERAAEGDEAAFKAGLEAMHAARTAKKDQPQPTEELANAGR